MAELSELQKQILIAVAKAPTGDAVVWYKRLSRGQLVKAGTTRIDDAAAIDAILDLERRGLLDRLQGGKAELISKRHMIPEHPTESGFFEPSTDGWRVAEELLRK